MEGGEKDVKEGKGKEMTEIRMTLQMAPVAKGRPKFSNRGGFVRAYTPAKTRRAENNILAQALPHRPDRPLQESAHVELGFFMPIPKSMRKCDLPEAIAERMVHTKKPDMDNLEKAVLDALNEVFWRDDSIVCSKWTQKVYSQNPRIEILIRGE